MTAIQNTSGIHKGMHPDLSYMSLTFGSRGICNFLSKTVDGSTMVLLHCMNFQCFGGLWVYVLNKVLGCAEVPGSKLLQTRLMHICHFQFESLIYQVFQVL